MDGIALQHITAWFSANQTVSTLILVTVFFLLRALANRLLRGEGDFVNEDRRRLISYTKNVLILLLLVGLAMIWAPALRTFALSVTAFLVALVIATKELILCITGGILRTSSGAFSVGDWVRIGEQRGEVLDQSFLSVTLQELEPAGKGHQFTGRTVTLPNSMFLTTSVINENFYKKFVYHTVDIVLGDKDDPIGAAQLMEAAMTRAISESREVSRRYNALIRRQAGVSMPSTEPLTRLSTTPEGKARVAVTAFVPTGDTGRIERSVMQEVMAALHQQRAIPPEAGQPT